MMKKFFVVFFLVSLAVFTRADEGMWIPLLLEKYNIEDMQEQGFRLSAEDIYSINKASLKDAVVIFGGGCTGEMVSEKGLLFTNHHCGYGYIQRHSSVENDYLTKGFWAMSREEELPNPGLKVSFLERIEDVTQEVLEGTENELTERSRLEKIGKNIEKITIPLNGDKHHRAVIKPFYYGNEYYMFVYKIYTDVRLVGAPPGAI
ncbi:MAG: S46 family peptidase, partial [Bacteroidota bacterium]